jgi:spore coat protein U-like protein
LRFRKASRGNDPVTLYVNYSLVTPAYGERVAKHFLPRLRRMALLAALVLTASPAAGQNSSAVGRVSVIEPLSLINTSDLSFGDFASGAAAGTVTVDQNSGARTVTGGVTMLGGTVSAASFLGAASGLNLIIIRQPATPVILTRVGGSETMRVTALPIRGGQFRLFFTRQAFSFDIGGTLQVGANQRAGTYVGTFNVTVDYY